MTSREGRRPLFFLVGQTLLSARRVAPLLLLLLVALLPLRAQQPTEAALAKRIEAIINRGDAAKAFWGIEVFAPARGLTATGACSATSILSAGATPTSPAAPCPTRPKKKRRGATRHARSTN